MPASSSWTTALMRKMLATPSRKVLESIKLGANDFVVKPFQPERVIHAVGQPLR